MCVNGHCLPKDYEKHDLPRKSGDKEAIEINIGFTYLEILEINEKDFSITFRTVLQGKWKEPRILPLELDVNEESNQVLNPSILDYLWIMNLFIYNLKEVRKFKTLTPGDSSLGKMMIKTVTIVDL